MLLFKTVLLLLKEKFSFLHILIRIFMTMHSVQQHYYDKWCSHKSWSSLLTSPLAENGLKHLRLRGISSASTVCWKMLVLKDETINVWWCHLRFWHKHKVEQQLLTCKRSSFRLLRETNSCFWVKSCCSTLTFSVGTWEDATKHSVIVLFFKTSVLWWIVKALDMPLNLHCFQLVMVSARSSSSPDCIIHHNNAVEHRIWS